MDALLGARLPTSLPPTASHIIYAQLRVFFQVVQNVFYVQVFFKLYNTFSDSTNYPEHPRSFNLSHEFFVHSIPIPSGSSR
jgi:hypothetical protein